MADRHEFIATREQCLMLVVDIQQAMLKAIEDWQPIVHRVSQLGRAAELLDVPVLVTEHYKKGLGATIPEVAGSLARPEVVEKIHFSGCLEPGFLERISEYKRSKIVLVGMETHVCVLQTGLDLIKAGYQVQLVRDAVGSRNEQDRSIAIELFRDAGAVITTAETVIFQWARKAGTAQFKKVLPIVK